MHHARNTYTKREVHRERAKEVNVCGGGECVESYFGRRERYLARTLIPQGGRGERKVQRERVSRFWRREMYHTWNTNTLRGRGRCTGRGPRM